MECMKVFTDEYYREEPTMKILTNNQWRPFKFSNEVPTKVLKEDYDHLGGDMSDAFIDYRGNWYHISDFELCSEMQFDDKGNWSGFVSESAFSGVLIEVSEDGDYYKIATFIS